MSSSTACLQKAASFYTFHKLVNTIMAVYNAVPIIQSLQTREHILIKTFFQGKILLLINTF
jgi:hypothetical protein